MHRQFLFIIFSICTVFPSRLLLSQLGLHYLLPLLGGFSTCMFITLYALFDGKQLPSMYSYAWIFFGTILVAYTFSMLFSSLCDPLLHGLGGSIILHADSNNNSNTRNIMSTILSRQTCLHTWFPCPLDWESSGSKCDFYVSLQGNVYRVRNYTSSTHTLASLKQNDSEFYICQNCQSIACGTCFRAMDAR